MITKVKFALITNSSLKLSQRRIWCKMIVKSTLEWWVTKYVSILRNLRRLRSLGWPYTSCKMILGRFGCSKHLRYGREPKMMSKLILIKCSRNFCYKLRDKTFWKSRNWFRNNKRIKHERNSLLRKSKPNIIKHWVLLDCCRDSRKLVKNKKGKQRTLMFKTLTQLEKIWKVSQHKSNIANWEVHKFHRGNY